MRVLMTADTVGGVWTYTQELVTGLTGNGIDVTLVSLGELPTPEQRAWIEKLPGVDYRLTTYKLEWMQDSQRDVQESTAYLEKLIAEVRPDILHSNQFCYGAIAADIPRIAVAHSDVVSWWVGVHGHEPEENSWIRWYQDTVTEGLTNADCVVAPSQVMLDAIRKYYVEPEFGVVIHNGRSPELFFPDLEKKDIVLSVGRLWDQGKQVSLLLDRDQAVPVFIFGTTKEPGKEVSDKAEFKEKVKVGGLTSQERLKKVYGQAAIYAATSCYEPFGLAPLEAALSRCALIMNDLPSFRELWGDSAYFFQHNDADDLALAIKILSRQPELRRKYGDAAYRHACERFTAEQMVKRYEGIYEQLTSTRKAA